jgi:AcrR family transcriptional regulator
MKERPPRGRDRARGIFAEVREQVTDHVKERLRERGVERHRRHMAQDSATRERLLAAAMQLFARDGFRHVTVRDIAREAHANLASVNYHFGDKMQLYTSVVQSVIDSVRDAIESTMAIAEELSPEEKLRHYLRTTIERAAASEDRRSELQRLFRHELSEPTSAAPYIFEQVVQPRLRWLARVVAAIIDCDPRDARVSRCVGSIQAQLLFFVAGPARELVFEKLPKTGADVEAEVEHILAFSLAGVHAIASGAARARGRR